MYSNSSNSTSSQVLVRPLNSAASSSSFEKKSMKIRSLFARVGLLRFLSVAVLSLAVSALPASAEAGKTQQDRQARVAFRGDGAGFAGVKDPAVAFFRENRIDLNDTRTVSSLLDQVYTLNHQVPVGDGRYLAVSEHFTLRSWFRFPRRAVLMLNGSAFRGNHFTMPVDGYDGGKLVAQRGGFAYTVDYLGVGDSFKPGDGLEASFEANRAALEVLIRYIRFFRHVPKIDLLGEGYGGALATELSADAARVRSVSMSAMIYREVGGGPLTDPFFVSLLETSPDGYFFVPGEGSLIFTAGAPQGVVDYIVATQGGFYPTPNFLVAVNRPFFDPSVARAPGLLIYGAFDFIGVQADLENLVAEWGDEAEFVFNPNAGHAPRTESPATADWFWTTIFDFINL